MRRCVYYNRRNRDTFKTMRLNKGEYNMETTGDSPRPDGAYSGAILRIRPGLARF